MLRAILSDQLANATNNTPPRAQTCRQTAIRRPCTCT